MPATTTFTLTVLYPNTPSAIYDESYYETTHLPLMQSLWAPYGLRSWSMTRYGPGPDGAEPAYAFGSATEWDSAEQMEAALRGPEMGVLARDLVNFSNREAVFLVGEVVRAG